MSQIDRKYRHGSLVVSWAHTPPLSGSVLLPLWFSLVFSLSFSLTFFLSIYLLLSHTLSLSLKVNSSPARPASCPCVCLQDYCSDRRSLFTGPEGAFSCLVRAELQGDLDFPLTGAATEVMAVPGHSRKTALFRHIGIQEIGRAHV